MTDEAAIETLKSIKEYYNDKNEYDEGYIGFDIFDNEALDLAIKALEQQPCEDCVSRTDVLKLMCEKCPVYDCITGCQSYRSIEKMPSVTLKAESEDKE